MQKYTPDEHKGIFKRFVNFVKDIKELILVISAVVMVLLNIIFTYKLAPLIETDQIANFRISAVERDFGQFEKRLDNIENKIDQLLLR